METAYPFELVKAIPLPSFMTYYEPEAHLPEMFTIAIGIRARGVKSFNFLRTGLLYIDGEIGVF